jgi:hypothetical protein
VWITGPANVVGGDGIVVLPGQNVPQRTVSGFGDVVASAFYNVLGPDAPLLLDLGGKIKFGTADEAEGLGTGKNDFSLQVDAFKVIGSFTPFATLGYRWYGDPPGVDLHNVVYGSVGTSYRISGSTTAGFVYDFRDRIAAGGARVSELMGFVSQKFSPTWKLQLYVVKGFTDASPDAGGGAVLAYSF